MRILLVLAAILLVAQAANLSASKFSAFKQTFKKTYSTKYEEKVRAAIFESNLNKIDEHNKRFEQGLETYNMGINQFADMTHGEFVRFLKAQGSNPTSKHISNTFKSLGGDVPEVVDWREKDAVTGVKDQGLCGSCWAFSASGSLESAYFLKSGELLILTEQQLVDCAGGQYENQGCNGGWMETAFDYIQDHGIATELNYPYKGYDSTCYDDTVNLTDIKVLGHTNTQPGNETELELAVATVGPVSVAVDATWFQFYLSGVFSNAWCGDTLETLNHGVVVVGYGTDEEGQKYWIIKNSWGAGWGENGYLRLAKDANNLCGVSTCPTYPNL